MRRLVILSVLTFCAFMFGRVPSAWADIMPTLIPRTNAIASPPPTVPPSGVFSASYTTITPGYFPNIPQQQTSFTLGGGTTLFGGSSAGALTISNLTIDAGPFASNLPPTATGPVNLSSSITITDPANSKTATFTFTNPATVNENGTPGGSVMGNLKVSAQLTSNNDPNLNLTAFANGGTFTANFANIDFEQVSQSFSVPSLDPLGGPLFTGVAIYPSGPNLPISFTFTLEPNAPPPSPAVPEPGSLALWGLAAAAGLAGLRRRLRKRMGKEKYP